MRRICVVISSRANYSSIKSALTAMVQNPHLQVDVVLAASAILDRYGTVADVVEKDGFVIADRVPLLIEGGTPGTMARSAGLGIMSLTPVLERLNPDYVLTVGDRFETISTAIAAAYLNLRIVHTMGGEVSGNIDEHVRHAVTKFSHLHFPATQAARDRVIALGERSEHVFLVGCPRIDLARSAQDEPIGDEIFSEGVGEGIHLDKPFLLVSQHPVTSEYGGSESQIRQTMEAVERIGLPSIVLWPNADAGTEDLSRGLRKWRETNPGVRAHFFKNLSPETYLGLMAKTSCLVGNSSSGIREGAFLGTPVVNIGSRQAGRERAENVVDSTYETADIEQSIRFQIDQGRYESSSLYGDGGAGEKIATTLASIPLVPLQKQLGLP